MIEIYYTFTPVKPLRYIFLLFFLSMGTASLFGQTFGTPPTLETALSYQARTLYYLGTEVDRRGDTTLLFRMAPLPVYGKLLIDRNKHWRLIRNVKIVYPIAKYANNKLLEMEKTLATMDGNRRAQESYTKQVEKDLKEQYTPIIKKMSFSQGKILIKLIDRQTGHTSYDLVKDMRGSFTAFFWQNLGRLFGMNLKDKYDKEGDDQLIEQVITYYEAGLL